ncbi:MAG TPA: asparaginase [Acidimicrobiia bacterium]|nr:asparaginase [Acidimicrobiia bacterium]
MRFLAIRTGLIESTYDVTVLAVDATGTELYRSGNPDRPLFYRSAVKPFQATAALEAGLTLPPEHLALTCASHGGWPVHLGIVRAILHGAGLDETALQCPPSWPLSQEARDLQVGRGVHSPQRVFHNCSGKHAGMLGACVARGWSIDSYLDPEHPLQRSIRDVVAEATGIRPEPVGTDGCGAPTLRGSVRGLARAFATLSSSERCRPAASAISRFPSLVADNARPDGKLARWWGGPVKVGAEGQIGIGRHGIGIAAKADAGRSDVAVAAVIAVAGELGLVSDVMREALASEAKLPLLGGGKPVGAIVLE